MTEYTVRHLRPHLFITDLGADVELTCGDGTTLCIGRYAVWERKYANSNAEIIATSGDLENLKQTFGDLPVAPLFPEK